MKLEKNANFFTNWVAPIGVYMGIQPYISDALNLKESINQDTFLEALRTPFADIDLTFNIGDLFGDGVKQWHPAAKTALKYGLPAAGLTSLYLLYKGLQNKEKKASAYMEKQAFEPFSMATAAVLGKWLLGTAAGAAVFSTLYKLNDEYFYNPATEKGLAYATSKLKEQANLNNSGLYTLKNKAQNVLDEVNKNVTDYKNKLFQSNKSLSDWASIAKASAIPLSVLALGIGAYKGLSNRGKKKEKRADLVDWWNDSASVTLGKTLGKSSIFFYPWIAGSYESMRDRYKKVPDTKIAWWNPLSWNIPNMYLKSRWQEQQAELGKMDANHEAIIIKKQLEPIIKNKDKIEKEYKQLVDEAAKKDKYSSYGDLAMATAILGTGLLGAYGLYKAFSPDDSTDESTVVKPKQYYMRKPKMYNMRTPYMRKQASGNPAWGEEGVKNSKLPYTEAELKNLGFNENEISDAYTQEFYNRGGKSKSDFEKLEPSEQKKILANGENRWKKEFANTQNEAFQADVNQTRHYGKSWYNSTPNLVKNKKGDLENEFDPNIMTQRILEDKELENLKDPKTGGYSTKRYKDWKKLRDIGVQPWDIPHYIDKETGLDEERYKEQKYQVENNPNWFSPWEKFKWLTNDASSTPMHRGKKIANKAINKGDEVINKNINTATEKLNKIIEQQKESVKPYLWGMGALQAFPALMSLFKGSGGGGQQQVAPQMTPQMYHMMQQSMTPRMEQNMLNYRGNQYLPAFVRNKMEQMNKWKQMGFKY